MALLFGISKSRAQRIVADLTPRIAALFERTRIKSQRTEWVIDGTLVPTRDHCVAAKSKNYRYSCNVQILARRVVLGIVAISGGGPGNRNDPAHYRGSVLETNCRRNGRVLADGGYRGVAELITPRFEHNRIVKDAAWRRHRRRRARIEHAIARLKDWRILRDHRRRAGVLMTTVHAVAALHNLRVAELRDTS